MKRGKFIVFEGLNGCGKGTQLERLTKYIYDLSRSNTIFRTREPNNFDVHGEYARNLLTSKEDPFETGLQALGYFALNRQNHNKIFIPILEKGIDVLCDRYWHSNFAFQGAQGIEYESIARLNSTLRVPDLTFIMDVDSMEAHRRLNKRDGIKNKRIFENNKIFVMKVRDNYLGLANMLPELLGDNSIVYVNGMKNPQEVFEQIKGIYHNKFD